MNVVYVMADKPGEKNCSIFNCENPVRAINKLGNGHKATLLTMDQYVSNTPEVQQICMESDVIVVERNFFQGTFVISAQWIANGRCVVGIFDDSYDKMLPDNVSFNFWNKGEIRYKNEAGEEISNLMFPPPLTQFKMLLKIMKGLQVVSKKLASDWKKYVPTYHIPNYLNTERYLNANPLYDFGDTQILYWGGSLSHHNSFVKSGIVPALETICKKYPKVKVLISGDKRNFDLLTGIPSSQKLFHPFVPEEKFASLLKCATIGLAPLHGIYDERRSWIKTLEYSYLKIVWVASNLVTYEAMRPYGLLTENTPESWEYNLSRVLDNLPQYQEKANTISYNFAASQNIDLNIEKTLKVYEKIISGPYNI